MLAGLLPGEATQLVVEQDIAIYATVLPLEVAFIQCVRSIVEMDWHWRLVVPEPCRTVGEATESVDDGLGQRHLSAHMVVPESGGVSGEFPEFREFVLRHSNSL